MDSDMACLNCEIKKLGTGGADRRIILEFGRRIDDYGLARTHPGLDLARIAETAAQCDRAALCLAVLHDKQDVFVAFLAQCRRGHQYAAGWARVLLDRLLLLEERDAHAHVRDDPV